MIFEIENTLFTNTSEDNKTLDLNPIMQKMQESPTTMNEDSNMVNSAGFHKIEICDYKVPCFEFTKVTSTNDEEETYTPAVQKDEYSSIKYISAEVTGQGSLGNYQQSYLDEEGKLFNENQKQQFYTHASIKLLENNKLIVFYEMTSSEKIKGQIITLFEEALELEISQMRVSSDLLLSVRNHTDWQNIKMDQIDNEDDRTTSVVYAVDLSNQTDAALIHEVYKNKGEMVQLTSSIPYDPEDTTLQSGACTVNLYQVGHRFSLLDSQFEYCLREMKLFSLYFSSLLDSIQGRVA